MNEHRRKERYRTFKGGSISFNCASGIGCIVRNISDTGACIELENALGIPDAFTLIIKPEYLKRSCEVAWRSGRRIGIRFA